MRDPRERLRGKLRLGDGVVLELEIGVELHQLGPVGAGAGGHRSRCPSPRAPSSLQSGRRPARRRRDRRRRRARRRAGGRARSPVSSVSPRRRWKRPSASGSEPMLEANGALAVARRSSRARRDRPLRRRRACPRRRGARAGAVAAGRRRRATATLQRERLAGEELQALGALLPDERRRRDRRLARAPLAQPGVPLGRVASRRRVRR